MKEYVKTLIKEFDSNSDGLISFEELCRGLKHFHVGLTSQEKHALMKKLDFNRDGDITAEEIYGALSKYENQ